MQIIKSISQIIRKSGFRIDPMYKCLKWYIHFIHNQIPIKLFSVLLGVRSHLQSLGMSVGNESIFRISRRQQVSLEGKPRFKIIIFMKEHTFKKTFSGFLSFVFMFGMCNLLWSFPLLLIEAATFSNCSVFRISIQPSSSDFIIFLFLAFFNPKLVAETDTKFI